MTTTTTCREGSETFNLNSCHNDSPLQNRCWKGSQARHNFEEVIYMYSHMYNADSFALQGKGRVEYRGSRLITILHPMSDSSKRSKLTHSVPVL